MSYIYPALGMAYILLKGCMGSPHSAPILPLLQLLHYSPTISIDKGSSTASLSSCMLVQSAHRGPVPLSVQSSFCIPGRTEIIVSCNIPRSSREQLGMVVPLPDTPKASIPPHTFPAYTVSQADDGTVCVCVRLMNTSTIDFQLQAGQKVVEFVL